MATDLSWWRDAPATPPAPKSSLSWWSDDSSDEGPNSSPPIDRPGDADTQVAAPAPPQPKKRRDMSKLGANLQAAGALPGVDRGGQQDKMSWWSDASNVVADTLGGTASTVANLLGRGASGAEKSIGGGVRGIGEVLQSAGEKLGPLAPVLQLPGKALEGLGSEAEYMGGRQAGESSQRLAGKPGAESVAAHVVEGVPFLAGLAATGGAAEAPAAIEALGPQGAALAARFGLIPTAAMGLSGAGSGLQAAEDAGGSPAQVATSALLHGASDAALGQIATVPLLGKLLHGVPAESAADAVLAVAKQAGLGALQSAGMDVAHELSRKIAGLPGEGLDAGQVAKNAAAQAILQAIVEAPAIETGARPQAETTTEGLGQERFSDLNQKLAAERQAEQQQTQPPVDRRVDLATRKKISEMSPDEMRAALTTDDTTGLPGNKRAYDEAVADNPSKPQAAIDLDYLKSVNDRIGHEAGTAIIRGLHQAMNDAGVDGYHLHGDEFAILGDTTEHVAQQMQDLREHLEAAGSRVHYEAPNGQSFEVPISFSYGIGEGYTAADEALTAAKAARTANGENIARGAAIAGLVENPTAGRSPNNDSAENPTPQATPDAAEGRSGVLAPKPSEVTNEEVQRPNEIRQEVRNAQEQEVSADAQKAANDGRQGNGEEGRLLGPPEGATSLKNAVTSAERIARGLPEVELAARKGNEEQWAEAKSKIAADPDLPSRLAKSIIDSPRPISGLENDILLHDRMRISLDHREALAAQEAAQKSGDKGALTEAIAKRAAAEAQMEVNDQAARVGGREWGHAGLARQKLIAEDYSPVNLIRRYKAATGEREVPEEVRAKIVDLARQLVAAEDAARGAEDTRSERAAQQVVARESRSRSRTAKKGDLDAEYADLAKQFAAKSATPRAGLDPELAAIVSKMARNRVRAGVNGLGELVDGIFNDVSSHVDGLEKRDIRDAIAGNDRSSTGTRSQAEQDLANIKKQALLLRRIDDLQEGNAPAKTTRPADSPDVAALKEKLRETRQDLQAAKKSTDQERLARTEARLKKRIADAERGVAPPKGRKPVADTPQVTALREQLRQTLIDQGLAPEEAKREVTDEQRLKARKSYTAKREAELQQQIASGDFTKKAPRPPVMDTELQAAQARVKALKLQADRMIRLQELRNRTTTEKALDWTAKWSRAVKLSGIFTTLQKLGFAASSNSFLFTPMNEVAGLAASKLPGYSKISERAPIEGGFSPASIAKSWADFFSKSTREDFRNHVQMREGKLELRLGKPKDDPNHWLDWFGHMHAAIKSMPKNAAFRLAMEKQALWYMKQGVNINDPAVEALAEARAYEYANRAIFMQDNAFVEAWRDAIRKLEVRGHKGSATAANVMLPIVKVPTNYVGDVLEYATGLPRSMVATVKALRAGVENLPPEEADHIMRLTKRGSVGAAMMSLGIAGMASGLIKGGGFYKKGEHRSKDDPGVGDIQIGGVNIPHIALHHPAIEALQIGANLARLLMHGEGVGTSAFYTGAGLAGEVPFFEEPMRMSQGLLDPGGASAIAGEVLRGGTLQPDLQRLAKNMDERGSHSLGDKIVKQIGWRHIEPTNRKAENLFKSPSGLWQEEELGIPGLRQNVRRR